MPARCPARARTRTASRSCSRAAACAAWCRPAWSLRWSGWECAMPSTSSWARRRARSTAWHCSPAWPQRAADAYCGPLASRSFVNPLRVLRGKPVIDVNDVLTIVTADRRGRSRARQRRRYRAALHRGRRGIGDGRRPARDAHAGGGLDRDPRLQPHAVGGRTAGGDRRAPLPRRRAGFTGAGRRGDRRRAPRTCSRCRRAHSAFRARARHASATV